MRATAPLALTLQDGITHVNRVALRLLLRLLLSASAETSRADELLAAVLLPQASPVWRLPHRQPPRRPPRRLRVAGILDAGRGRLQRSPQALHRCVHSAKIRTRSRLGYLKTVCEIEGVWWAGPAPPHPRLTMRLPESLKAKCKGCHIHSKSFSLMVTLMVTVFTAERNVA